MAAPNTYTPASYNAPPGTPSSIGPQAYEEYHQKQALIEARREQFFTQLADVTVMPKNMGKKITKFHYIPLLDDRNVNDQGIDANGATIANGNLYGSSKDIGVITGKLPALTEHGGRVNRVGFTRIELEGTLEKFGFYEEFTQESLDFDSDAELDMHITREMVNGAHQMSEAALQIDILNAAGVIRYAGDATSTVTLNSGDVVTYDDLLRLGIQLTNNRTPRTITQINGTRLTDTRTIPGARPLHCGSELIPTLKGMKDMHNNPAFISVEKYAAGGETLIGEIGQIDEFRIIIVPEMLKWAGGGALVTDALYHDNGVNYDVFPMLCIGDGSFTTIGFQTDGKSVKFKIIKKLPGVETADRLDPYGEMGFMAIKWYYGFMTLRSERIGLIKTLALL
jgi:N4-gp56 family major capsid protein